MFKKMEFNEKFFSLFMIVALIAGMVVWVHSQGVNTIMQIKDVITKNTKSEAEFIMSFSR